MMQERGFKDINIESDNTIKTLTKKEILEFIREWGNKTSICKIIDILGISEKTIFKNVFNSSKNITEEECKEIKDIIRQADKEAGSALCDECQCNSCHRCSENNFEYELGGCQYGACWTCNGHMRKNCPDFKCAEI